MLEGSGVMDEIKLQAQARYDKETGRLGLLVRPVAPANERRWLHIDIEPDGEVILMATDRSDEHSHPVAWSAEDGRVTTEQLHAYFAGGTMPQVIARDSATLRQKLRGALEIAEENPTLALQMVIEVVGDG